MLCNSVHPRLGVIPALYLLGGSQHGTKVAHISLHTSDLSIWELGQQLSADSSSFAWVPASQAEQERPIFCQQPLAEGKAHAAVDSPEKRMSQGG